MSDPTSHMCGHNPARSTPNWTSLSFRFVFFVVKDLPSLIATISGRIPELTCRELGHDVGAFYRPNRAAATPEGHWTTCQTSGGAKQVLGSGGRS